MQIFVLGMHRSGTSAVTSVLVRMGAYPGPEQQSIGANEENPKGFYERRDVVDLDVEAFTAIGADWHRVTGFDLERRRDEQRQDHAARIDTIVSELDGHRPWVLKDPRMCFTLPIWLAACDRPVVVFAHRCPIEVADSLRVRNDFAHVVGIALWEAYTVEALRNCRDVPVVPVSYADLVSDPRTTTARLRRDLADLGVESLRSLDAGDLDDIIDRDLYRNRADHRDPAEFMNATQFALYRAMRDGSAFDEFFDAHLSEGGRITLEEFEAELEAERIPDEAFAGDETTGEPAMEPRKGMSPRYQRLERRYLELAQLQHRTSRKRAEAESAYEKAKQHAQRLEENVTGLRERLGTAEESYRVAKDKRDEALEAYRREKARHRTGEVNDDSESDSRSEPAARDAASATREPNSEHES